MLADDSCLNFEMQLADYLEGEPRPALLAHARQCDFCRCVLADIEQVRALGSEMLLEEPSAALWKNIRAALVAEGIIRVRPASRGWRMLRGIRSALWHPLPVTGLAAAVTAIIILLGTPGYLVRHPAAPSPAIQRASVYQYMAPGDIAQLTRTIRQLERSYRVNESYLEPSMKATYEKSLESLNSEIQECQNSLNDEANRSLASQYLSTAYVQKAELLQSALEYGLHQ